MDKETGEDSAKLLRKTLGSVDPDILEEDLTQEEIKERASEAVVFYQSWLEKVLKQNIQEQLEFIGTEAQTEDQWLFGRGTINGLNLIKEWFEEQQGIVNEERIPREDSINPIDNI